MEGLYEGFGLRGFRWWESRTVHLSVQVPRALLSKCPPCLAGVGGSCPRGKASATSHCVCCSSGVSCSGTALRHGAAPRAPAAPEYRNLCDPSEYAALGGCCQSQAAVCLSLCMKAFLPWQPLVSPWNSEELSSLPELLSQLVRRKVAKNGRRCHSRGLLPIL